MPALRLFGRKWLAASDDLVFPSLFEICFRLVWLILIAIVCEHYWNLTWSCAEGGLGVRIYLGGTLLLIIINLLLLIGLVNRSAQGSITEPHLRRAVGSLLVSKVLLIIPEVSLNVFGTIWAFCNVIKCTTVQKFSRNVIEAIVLFNWVLFALIIFGMAIVFDPLGSTKYRRSRDTNDNNGPTESAFHRKVYSLWMRRFRWAFCCLRKDEFGHEAFAQVASLLSALFRGTDLVPSDFMAGCVLLRVRQKRETREMRRIRMLNDDGPRYSTDLARIFATAPPWMTIKNARHFMRFALASYGWPLVCYMHCCTGPYRLIKKSICCACFRSKYSVVVDDNCCLCHFAGVKFMSRLRNDDVLYASFRNHVFELPFCVLADHSTKSIVVTIRGSFSFRDIFTDLTANCERFEAPGMPPDSAAHRGMVAGVEQLMKRLQETKILDRAFTTYPEYSLVFTGHSLGAGVAILMGAKLRTKYPDLRVYAFATPAGLLSREAARYTETYAFTVGVGDDFVMRLGVDSIENLRTMIIETIRACKLPKYRIMLNGFGYAIFGVPSRDLETTFFDVTQIETSGQGSSSEDPPISTITPPTASMLSQDIGVRRFAKTRLYTGGRILHIVRRKRTELEKKSNSGGPTFEMRWATPEDFTELKIMPRMFLDHFPDYIYRTMSTILEEQKATAESITSIHEI